MAGEVNGWCDASPEQGGFLILCQPNQLPSHGPDRQGDCFSLGV